MLTSMRICNGLKKNNTEAGFNHNILCHAFLPLLWCHDPDANCATNGGKSGQYWTGHHSGAGPIQEEQM